MKKLSIICLLFSISIGNLYSQHKTIRGRVISEDLEISQYTSIVINDSIGIGKTDLNGYFQIEIPISVKKILFMDVGIETASIDLIDKCQDIEVVMMSSYTYDFMPPKKVDRKRDKRFKKLPELRKEAFEKGMFKTANGCGIQEFIPYYKKK